MSEKGVHYSVGPDINHYKSPGYDVGQPPFNYGPPPPAQGVHRVSARQVQPRQQMSTHVTVTTQPNPIGFTQQITRDSPMCIVCPHCSVEVVTTLRYQTADKAYTICFILCCIGCDAGCCLIPLFMDTCKDVYHDCPNCRQTLGIWKA